MGWGGGAGEEVGTGEEAWGGGAGKDIHMILLSMSCDCGQLRSSAQIDHMKT